MLKVISPVTNWASEWVSEEQTGSKRSFAPKNGISVKIMFSGLQFIELVGSNLEGVSEKNSI